MDPGTANRARVIENMWRFIVHLWRGSAAALAGRGGLEVWRIDLLRRVYMLWFEAPNWATLVELNRRYLQGRLPSCASAHEPTNFDAVHVNNLLRLHEYGLVVTYTCPGMAQDLELTRALLFFSIPTTRALAIRRGATRPNVLRKFILRLLSSPDTRAHIRYQYSTPSPGLPRPPEIMQLLQPDGFIDNLPVRQVVEWEREDWFEERDAQNETIGWSFSQHMTRSHIGQDFWDLHPESGEFGFNRYGSYFEDDEPGQLFRASAEADPLQICVVARDWDFRRIPQLIEELLQDAGVVRGPDFVQQ